MSARLALFAACFVAALPLDAHAQTVRLDPARGARAEVAISTGYDRAILPVTVQGAMRVTAVPVPLVLGLAWTVPTLTLDLRDQRLRVCAELDLRREHGFLFRVANGWSMTTTRNDAFSAVALGGDLGFTTGFSAPRFLVGAEVTAGLTFVSFLRSRGWTQDLGSVPFERGVRYGSAFTVRAGLRTGVVLGPIELSLRVGWDRVGQYSITPPMYAHLGLGARFGHAQGGTAPGP